MIFLLIIIIYHNNFSQYFRFALGRDAKYCNQRVCMSVRLHLKIDTSKQYMLPVVVARSSAVDIAIRYVLPVLWMTSCFHIMEQMSIQVCGLRRSELFTLLARWRRYIAHAVAKSALLDCLVPFWRRIRLFCGLSFHSLTAACVARTAVRVWQRASATCTGRCVKIAIKRLAAVSARGTS